MRDWYVWEACKYLPRPHGQHGSAGVAEESLYIKSHDQSHLLIVQVCPICSTYFLENLVSHTTQTNGLSMVCIRT